MRLASLTILVFAATCPAQEDRQHAEWMKAVGDSNGAIRKALQGGAVADAAAPAAKMAEVLDAVETFWARRDTRSG